MANDGETDDRNKKIFYASVDLAKTARGKYKCICCQFTSNFSQSVVIHISQEHPQYVHKPRRSFGRNSSVNGFGNKKLLKEDPPGPNKPSSPTFKKPKEELDIEEIFYKTTDLRKNSDGNYKCLCCPYNSTKRKYVVRHISFAHPQYINKVKQSNTPTVRDRLRREIKNCTDEELPDDKKLFYTTSQLQEKHGLYKCLACSYSSPNCSAIVLHISQKHPKFIYTPVSEKMKPCTEVSQTANSWIEKELSDSDENSRESVPPSRGINIWTHEELSDPNKKLYYLTKDLEKEDGRYKCFCCPYESPVSQNVHMHILSYHPRFLHTPRLKHKQSQSRNSGPKNSSACDTSDDDGEIKNDRNTMKEGNEKRKAYPLSNSPKRRPLRNRKSFGHEILPTSDQSACDKNSREMINDVGNPSLDDVGPLERLAIAIEKNETETDERLLEENDDDGGWNFNDHTDGDAVTHDASLADHTYVNDCSVDFRDVDGTSNITCDYLLQTSEYLSTLQNTDFWSPPVQICQNPSTNEENSALESMNVTRTHISKGSQEQLSDNPIYMEIPVIMDTKFVQMVEARKTEKGEDPQNMDGSHNIIKNEDDLERILHVPCDLMTVSTKSLKAKRSIVIAKSKEEMSRRKKGEPLLDVRERIEKEDLNSTTGWGVPELFKQLEIERKKVKSLENAIATKETQFENLFAKTVEKESHLKKQLEVEREKVAAMENQMISRSINCVDVQSRNEEMEMLVQFKNENTTNREKELIKKLAEAESKLKRCEKVLELRDKQEKLRLEQEHGLELLKKIKKEAEEALEETMSIQEGRLREMEKIQMELSTID